MSIDPYTTEAVLEEKSLLSALNPDTYLDDFAEFFKWALTFATVALSQKLDGTINLCAACCITRLHTFLQCSIQPVLTDLK